MRHFVMTRSAYGSAWGLDANRRRLDMTRAVTVAGMAGQIWKGWEWLVAIDIADPLADERMRLFESAGVPVRFLEVRSTGTPQAAAFAAYSAPWNELLGYRDEPLAMTRLDDDDTLAPWAMACLAKAASRMRTRTALVLPRGIRVWNGRLTVVRHDSNAMQTLVTPPGDTLHVYGYGHRDVRDVARVKHADPRIAWLWSRHPDTISGWRTAHSPIEPRIRELFPAVDWSVFGEPRHQPRRAAIGGRYFR